MGEHLGWTGIAWMQCWQVTALIALVWVMTRLVARNRPHLACALWLIVLCKCVTPPLWSSPSGVFCWLQRTERALESSPVRDGTSDLALITPRIPAAEGDDAVVVQMPQSRQPSAEFPFAAEADKSQILQTQSLQPASSVFSATAWPTWLGAAWILGSLGYAGVTYLRWRSCWRKIRLAGEVSHPAVAGLLEDLRQQLGLRRSVRLLITRACIGPAVVGLWRPLVILPWDLVRNKSLAELEPLLAHELLHIRRGDLWVGLLQTLAQIVWWFHPLVRMASRVLSRETERCCDEAVIAHLACEPAVYARGLIEVLALKKQLQPVPACPGVRPVEVTSQRLERIMKLRQGCRKQTPWWCWLAMFLLAAAVLPGAALVVGAKERTKKPSRRSEPRVSEPYSAEPGSARSRSAESADTAPQPGSEIAIEVRIVSGAEKLMDALPVKWSVIDAAVDVPAIEPLAQNESGSFDATKKEVRSRVESVVEKSHPAVYAVLEEGAVAPLLNEIQADPRANILQAPKITLDNGQSSRIESLMKRPFVVAVRPVGADAHEPRIRVVEVGWKLQLRPRLERNRSLELDFGLTLSEVRNVETFDLPSDRPQKTTVQVPEIATTRIAASVPMKHYQTLVIRMIPSGEDKSQPQWMLVKVRQVLQVLDASVRSDKSKEAGADPYTEANAISDAALAQDRKETPISATEIPGWRLRFFPRDGAPWSARSQASSSGQETEIKGGVRLEAMTKERGPSSQTILAEADELRYSSDTGMLRLSGDVHFRDDRSVLRCQGLAMHFRKPKADAAASQAETNAATVEFAFDGVQTLEYVKPAGSAKTDDEKAPNRLEWDARPAGQGTLNLLSPEPLIEKVYPVADLVIPMTSEPIIVSLGGKPAKNSPPPRLKPDFEALVNLVITTIHPDSWESVGGQGSISCSENTLSLIVAQRPEIHERLAEIFEQLRRIQDVQILYRLQLVQIDQESFERWASERGGDLLDLAKFKATSAVLSSKDALKFRDHVKSKTTRDFPRLTVFNGQQVELCNPQPDGVRLVPGLQLLGVIAADIQSFRISIGAGTGDGKFRPATSTQPLTVRHGSSLLIDVAEESWGSQEKEAPAVVADISVPRLKSETPATRTFYLLTPRMMMNSEKAQSRALSPRK